jgi:anthranilate phosphoribosyltransferase
MGLARAEFDDVAGGLPAHNADVARRILAGEPGPARELGVLNAGAAVYVSGRVDSLADGVHAAEAAIDAGAAAETLERLVALTSELSPGVTS